eukprot:Nitzschia sp. Nitz4//scaffold14_size191712//138324//140688//NITZ4_001744-RA/size191712-snap-gene-0.140-mRNA-1//1//CDS//3329536990//7340//frame0
MAKSDSGKRGKKATDDRPSKKSKAGSLATTAEPAVELSVDIEALASGAGVETGTTSITQGTTSKAMKRRPTTPTNLPPLTMTATEPATTSQSKSSKKKKGRPPKLDVAALASGPTPSDAMTPTTPTVSKAAQDKHPFARSSVIEVWHGVEDPTEESWWSEDSEDLDPVPNVATTTDEEGSEADQDEAEDPEEDDDMDDDDDKSAGPTEETKSSPLPPLHRLCKPKPGITPSVRLCDVIDRVSTGEGKWRYYVHYRDFNRRMDEWVSMERIVSPPSIGNAKARAIKKEEERQRRKQAREEEKQKAELVDITAPRASRRRHTSLGGEATLPGAGNEAAATGVADAAAAVVAHASGALAIETPRQTRKRRKNQDDDATVVAGNVEEGGSDVPVPPTVAVAEKGIVAVPIATHTTAVGEHIVETIAAQELDEHEGLDEASLREHEEVTKVKNVAFLELGAHQMETWYFSPLPKELLSERGFTEVLYVCEFTFSMFARKSELQRFQARLPVSARHPPGNEIYRKGNLSMFEVDGFEERIYCQNLCYIAKLFLDHKTLYFDVDPFLFYVLCEVDDRGFHPVGYYSKEKYSDVGYNLACILTFPCHQRKGYGRFLIAFSYELTKKEEKVGSPEKPMSDLGQQAYKPYWASTIVDFLLHQAPNESNLSIMDISKRTSIISEDIVFTLNQLGLLKIINGVYFVAAEEGLLRTLEQRFPVKEPRVDASRLHWSPFVTDIKRDKFSIHSKKPNVDESIEQKGNNSKATPAT